MVSKMKRVEIMVSILSFYHAVVVYSVGLHSSVRGGRGEEGGRKGEEEGGR